MNSDDVDWSALRHAYGPATDLPDLIRAAGSVDADARNRAIYELWGTVWHQGTVYQATPAAVPYLAEVASDRRLPDADRWQLLWMLGEIALGSPVRPDDPRFVEASHAAVAAAASDLLREAPSGPLTGWALVGLAAAVPEAATGSRDRLEELLRSEPSPAFRAALRLTLRLIAGERPSNDELLTETAESPAVREFAFHPEADLDSRFASKVARYLVEDGLGYL